MKKVFLMLFVLSVVYGLMLVVKVLWHGSLNLDDFRMFFSVFSLAIYSIVALICYSILITKYKTFGYLGIVFSCGSLVYALMTTWLELGDWPVFKIRTSLFIIALSIAHICMMLRVTPYNSAVKALLALAFVSNVLLAAMLLSLTCKIEGVNTLCSQLLHVPLTDLIVSVSVIAMFTTVLTPIINRHLLKQYNLRHYLSY